MNTDTQHPRPRDDKYYGRIRAEAADAPVVERVELTGAGGAVTLAAGQVITIRLDRGPQIVGMLPIVADDPDERFWAHETFLMEGFWLTRGTRLWSTMPRYRPLLTCLEDTVVTRRVTGADLATHHPIPGGWNTPLQWKTAEGPSDRLTVWEQMVDQAARLGFSPAHLKDEVSLFEKVRIDGYSQELLMQPSDAIVGDYVRMFAETDIHVLLTLNPYVDGSRQARELVDIPVRPVTVEVSELIETPLPWPYPDVAYPDIDLYVDETGRRSTLPGPTPGLESPPPPAHIPAHVKEAVK